jgi:multicomponent Na+:H+ antiporter subunit B
MKGPDSYIFRTVVRFSFFIINIAAFYLLLRGHNLPGGGFIGGLASSISFLLLSLAMGVGELHKIIRIDPVRIAAGGLLLAVLTGLLPVFAGGPFLEHSNFHVDLGPLLGDWHFGTPLLFDIGVYFVVVGVTCKIIFVLTKSTQGLRPLVNEEEARYSSVRETPIEQEPAAETPEGKEREHAT